MDSREPPTPTAPREPCSLCRHITYVSIVAAGGLGYPHHESLSRLEHGAKSCSLCSLVLEAIQQKQGSNLHQSSKAPPVNVTSRSSAQDAPPKASVKLRISRKDRVSPWEEGHFSLDSLLDEELSPLDLPEHVTVSWNDYIRDVTDGDNEYQEVPRHAVLAITQNLGEHPIHNLICCYSYK